MNLIETIQKNNLDTRINYETYLMLNGFCMIVTGNEGNKIMDLEEYRDMLIGFRDKKELSKVIVNIQNMIDNNNIFNNK